MVSHDAWRQLSALRSSSSSVAVMQAQISCVRQVRQICNMHDTHCDETGADMIVSFGPVQEVFLTSSHVAIIMELGDGGDLSRFTAAQCDPAVSARSALSLHGKKARQRDDSIRALHQLAESEHTGSSVSVHHLRLTDNAPARRAEGWPRDCAGGFSSSSWWRWTTAIGWVSPTATSRCA